MTAPKLRFKEFDSDWSKVKLKELVISLDAGVSVNGEDVDVTEDDFSVLKTSCVSLGVFNANERKLVNLENEIQRLKEPLLDNSLVMNRSNTPLLVGSSAFIKKAPKNTYLSDKLWQIKVNDKADIRWLSFHLSSETTLIKLRDMATGTSNSMKNITKSDVLNFELSAPSKQEQTKIASFLSAVDEKISQLNQKYELLSQYKQGMMQKLFSQQIRFKADDGSEFGEWENTVLGDIADIVGGGTPSTNNEEYWSGDVVWLTPSEINQKFIGESKRTISELGVQKSSAKKLPIGTILFTSRATIGEVAIAIAEVTTNQGFQSFISNEKTFNEFLYYWIVNNKKSFIERASGSTFLEISKSKIQPMEISLPCLEEQTKIANFLSAIDQKIEVVAQQIEQAKIWKKGLLQQMFV